MADIEAGKVDCVVVYKVDRLSRSLIDFAKMMELFEKRGVCFVSVTQQFNTKSSLGRLTLNILFSFAQFEREIISERRGTNRSPLARKESGRRPPDPGIRPRPARRRLIVNAEEAERVREIFRLYLEGASVLDIVRRLDRWAGGTTVDNPEWQTVRRYPTAPGDGEL